MKRHTNQQYKSRVILSKWSKESIALRIGAEPTANHFASRLFLPDDAAGVDHADDDADDDFGGGSRVGVALLAFHISFASQPPAAAFVEQLTRLVIPLHTVSSAEALAKLLTLLGVTYAAFPSPLSNPDPKRFTYAQWKSSSRKAAACLVCH
ncbi:unnamed protein product [Heligmosomoides polygyrus]|uniref:Hat1_N domain-containing protein n=1 Tax=Heligmosomoides polygyrus TaxID=6339 RepID=A0A183FK14_HELPZ|nr:unnamed protein product [Heligmosomoides polygyrus]